MSHHQTPSEDDCSPEAIKRFRRDSNRRLNEKLSHVQFASDDQWLALALANNVPGMRSRDDDILISVRGIALPEISTYWTGLLVVTPKHRQGHAWFNEVTGALPFGDMPVCVYAGDRRISRRKLKSLLELLDQNELDAIPSVKDRCYDGAPTRVKLCKRKNGQVIETSGNAADDGLETTLALIKILWEIKAETKLSETQRFP